MPSPTWAQGQLLEVQLPFPAPHLQRPSDSGSHSRDSTPREQFSKGLIGQRLACSPFLPSLSLVAGVQGQTFDYWPEHLLPPSSPPYSLPLTLLCLFPPSVSLPLFLFLFPPSPAGSVVQACPAGQHPLWVGGTQSMRTSLQVGIPSRAAFEVILGKPGTVLATFQFSYSFTTLGSKRS